MTPSEVEAQRLNNIHNGVGCPHGRRVMASVLRDCRKCDEFESDLMNEQREIDEGRYFDEGGTPEGGEFIG